MSNVQVSTCPMSNVQVGVLIHITCVWLLSVHATVSGSVQISRLNTTTQTDSSQCSCLVILWQQNIVISVHFGILTRTPTLTSSSPYYCSTFYRAIFADYAIDCIVIFQETILSQQPQPMPTEESLRVSFSPPRTAPAQPDVIDGPVHCAWSGLNPVLKRAAQSWSTGVLATCGCE